MRKFFTFIFLFSLNSFALDFSLEGCAKISGIVMNDSCEYTSRDGRVQRFGIKQDVVDSIKPIVATVNHDTIVNDSLDIKKNIYSIAKSSNITASIVTIQFIMSIASSIFLIVLVN